MKVGLRIDGPWALLIPLGTSKGLGCRVEGSGRLGHANAVVTMMVYAHVDKLVDRDCSPSTSWDWPHVYQRRSSSWRLGLARACCKVR
jgi:hypothetical protein